MERIALYILLDGVGWRQAEATGLLAARCLHRRPLRTVLGYSGGAVPTLLSGKLPVETGQWVMWRYAPATSPFRRWRATVRLPAPLRRLLGITRERITAGFRERRGITGYCAVYQIPDRLLPLVDTPVGHSLYQPGALDPVETIFDRWTRGGIPYRVYGYPAPDRESLAAARADLAARPTPVVFLHLYETDAFLHTRCTDAAAVRECLAGYAAEIERLVQAAAAAAGSVELTLFSDHGMAPVTGRHDLMAEVEATGLAVGRDYVPLYDSTLARFWCLRPGAEAAIRARLARLDCGRVLDDRELERLGVGFPDRRFGHPIFLMHPGQVIAPSHMGAVPPEGMHGFHPEEDPWADAMLLSTAPLPETTRHIADLADLLAPAGGPA